MIGCPVSLNVGKTRGGLVSLRCLLASDRLVLAQRGRIEAMERSKLV